MCSLYMQEQLFKLRQEHHHQPVPSCLDVSFRENSVGKMVFLVSAVRTSFCVNHMQIPCWEICAKFHDYTWIRSKHHRVNYSNGVFNHSLLYLCGVCVLHIKSFFPLFLLVRHPA